MVFNFLVSGLAADPDVKGPYHPGPLTELLE
jgi:hypothetical protein